MLFHLRRAPPSSEGIKPATFNADPMPYSRSDVVIMQQRDDVASKRQNKARLPISGSL